MEPRADGTAELTTAYGLLLHHMGRHEMGLTIALQHVLRLTREVEDLRRVIDELLRRLAPPADEPAPALALLAQMAGRSTQS